MITVQELQQHIMPAGTRFVAGKNGLHREVSWVVVSRSRPPIFENLKGNELVLISMRALRALDEEFPLSRLFSYLSEMSVSAAAVLGEVNDIGVETADELDLPLFVLPEGISLPELERTITKYIADNNQQIQQWNQDVYRQFTELAIEGKGLASIAELLCRLTARAVIVEDANFRLRVRYLPESTEAQASPVTLASSRGRVLLTSGIPGNFIAVQTPPGHDGLNSVLRENSNLLREWLHNKELRASDPPLHVFEADGHLSQLVAPIIAQSTISGYVSLIGSDFDRKQRVALARAASALAIERAREIAVSQVEDRFQANVLDELLDGTYSNPEAVIDRAKRLGYNLQLPYWIVAFALRQQERNLHKKPLTIVLDGRELELDMPVSESMGREMQRLVEQESTRRQITTITRVRDDRFVVLFANSNGKDFPGPVDAKKIARIFQERIAAHFGDISVSGGLGRRFDEGVEGLSKESIEAEKAVTMGLRLFGPGQLTYFGDLGVYRLLLSIGATKELRDFYNEVLGRLIEHDAHNGGELLKTLEAYFRYHGSPSEMARGMTLHRNTLLYRLRRIEDITGLDLEDAETGLALHLALRIGEVLGENRWGTPVAG
ncbi:MAG TPA: helix-turn-helix domain-containing protein [Chloroflexia bacterium]|nr:helix-turn-helix domain-containing protein [Chloroflexia bacterium]